jgi:hypothetical protein
VFAFADVVYFFADKLARLRCRGFALTFVASRPLESVLLWAALGSEVRAPSVDGEVVTVGRLIGGVSAGVRGPRGARRMTAGRDPSRRRSTVAIAIALPTSSSCSECVVRGPKIRRRPLPAAPADPHPHVQAPRSAKSGGDVETNARRATERVPSVPICSGASSLTPPSDSGAVPALRNPQPLGRMSNATRPKPRGPAFSQARSR